ncbi:KamA family radical SAM protein [Streptomyces luteolus]|uniref:Radical SAM protein n=1 Tax=Streptomyces luteolus TaxID=3043615 RepID=A0ABT6SWQ4_9ACTN|nr:radical SAM protein [Streptomyces sp. B-S-A12]MDI3419851.1 radical SAM protein [Streptomyces sp. B-S-A12]
MTIEAAPAVAQEQWTDWKWQQRNAIRTARQFKERFPLCDQELLDRITSHNRSKRFQVTPYYLSLIGTDPDTGGPQLQDPLWKQVAPVGPEQAEAPYAYDGKTENWELPHEMVTAIAQHKYENRVIVRYANVCHAYCQFCYEALRTLDKDSTKATFDRNHWRATLDYLRVHPQVEEVILSGGEPFMHSNDQIDQVLREARAARPDLILRIHTRALTFNPYRIDEALADVLARHGVVSIGLHVTHPRELTPEFDTAVRCLQKAVPIIFANVPLLGGVNDTPETMRELSMGLYRRGVHAGYLYHFMPHSPESECFRTPVQRGVEIVRSLKRHISNPAVPEYVLPHATGKYTVPLVDFDSAAGYPRHVLDDNGLRVLELVNWQGERVHYPDLDLA